MKDMSLNQAEAIIADMTKDREGKEDLTIEDIEDFGFLLLKAVAVVRRDLVEKEKSYGY